MKKIFTILLCLILCLSLCSCGKEIKITSEKDDGILVESSVVNFDLNNVHNLSAPLGYTYAEVNMVTEQVTNDDSGIYDDDNIYEPVWNNFKSETLKDCFRQENWYYLTADYEDKNGQKGQVIYVCDFRNDKLISSEVHLNDIAYTYIYSYGR